MNQLEARAVAAGMLLNKVKEDRYPSSTEMSLIEEIIPPQLLPRYVDVLMEKIAQDRRPSISMIHRLNRVIASMPPEVG
jgi:hypothetical protein